MSRSGYCRPRAGFTLVELLVVIGIIVILVAIFMPVTRGTREPARRMQCGNNIKQLVLGLQNYHDTFLCLPYGARSRTLGSVSSSGVLADESPPTWGASWLVATLPFCEQRPLFDKIYTADVEGGSDYASEGVRQAAHNAKIKYLLCPSSPLAETENLGGLQLIVPSYAGIMGASDHVVRGPHAVVDTKERFVPGPYKGWVASNGMLLVNECTKFADCTDGTANMLLVGEVADWYYDDAGKQFNPALAISDAGDGPHLNSAGWLAGTDLDYAVQSGGRAIPTDHVCNLITLAHAIGTNNRGSKRDQQPNWGTSGVGRCGLNNPLTSAHPAGAMVGYLDGHVQLLTKQTDVYIIKRLGIRDDGGELPPDF